MSRTCRLAAVAALALLGGGCGSNNDGKIVGRWKAETADLPIGPQGPTDLVWEFAEDGTFTVAWVNVATKEALPKARGRYALGLRDNVSFTNLDPPLDGKKRANEKIVIDGDTMTVGGGGTDKTYKFTRLPPQ